MHQGGVRLCRAMLFSIASVCLLAEAFCVSAIEPNALVISKVQITGGTGLTSHDFITIYNRSEAAIDLNGLRLVKRTKTGTSDTTIKSWGTTTLVQPSASYTWANADIASQINADTNSSQTISNDNGIALRDGAEDSGAILDSVAWGEAANIFIEGVVFPINPAGGQYLQRINNSDTENNAEDFEIYPPIEETEITETAPSVAIPAPSGKDIIINELFVNPKELDGPAAQGEFIELYNKGTERAALDDWRIEIGDIVYELPHGTTLAPGGFTSIRDPKNIPLPNAGATVKLFAPGRTTATQTISYKQAPDGFSYANFAAAWRWTAIATPDKTNILAQAPKAAFDIIGLLLPNIDLRFDSSDSFTNNQAAHYAWNFGNGQTSTEQYPKYHFSKSGKYTISLTVTTEYGSSQISKTISIGKIEEEAIEKITTESETKVLGEKISADSADSKTETNDIFTSSGTAVSQPGSFGVQYFYFLPEYGEPLIQIYNSKKLFPKIEIGDQLIITGKYTERPEGPRVTTKEQKDINISGKGPIEKPELISSAELKKIAFPRLVTVEGTVASKKSPRIFLSDEEGEIEVYLSAGTKLKVSEFNIGDKISVTGIVIINDNKPRIQARTKDDIKKVANIEATNNSEDGSIASLPISQTALPETFQNNTETPKKNILLIYIVSGSVIVLGAIGYFLFKPH